MAIQGYPDLLSYRQRLQTTSALKEQLAVSSQEAITGKKADITEATRVRLGGVYLMQKALNDIDQEARINTVTRVRLDLISEGISGAMRAIDGIDTRAILALNSERENEIEAIADEAETSLRSAMTSISRKHGARNLFSGNATDTPVYANPDQLLDDVRNIMETAGSGADIQLALDTYFNDPAGGFQTQIYTGGSGLAPPIRLNPNDTLEIEVKGDHDTLKSVLRGFAVLATATSSGHDVKSDDFIQIFNDGIQNTGNGKNGLISIEANLGLYKSALEKVDTRNQAEALSVSTAFQSITGRDQFEAAAELQQLQVQLESSYLLTSRLSQLSLSNFLR